MKTALGDITFEKQMIPAGVALFVIALHFFTDIAFQGNPVRVSFADLLLPVMLAFVLVDCLSNKDLPVLRIQRGWVWLSVLSLWMVVSFFTGLFYTGGIQTWALVNKLAGWFVLMGYFVCGVWLSTRRGWEASAYAVMFIGAGAVVALYAVISVWLLVYGYKVTGMSTHVRAQGFSLNPNAFGILMACSLMLHLSLMEKKLFFNRTIHYIIAVILWLALYYSLSRSAWLGAVFGVMALLFIQRGLMKILILSLCGAVLVHTLVFHGPRYVNDVLGRAVAVQQVVKQKNLSTLTGKQAIVRQAFEQRTSQLKNRSYRLRVTTNQEALGYWIKTPVWGTGLGGYFWRRSAVKGKDYEPLTIHNTALWLLTETGLIGLVLFAGFFVACFVRLAGSESRLAPLSAGVAGVLAVMLGASAGTEILYQRYLWFFLGLALAVSSSSRPRDVQAATH